MACRIGITADPDERKRFWKGKYRKFDKWEILSTHRSKSAAQAAETKLAEKHGCTAHGGGAGSEKATWYVYKFKY